jgi:hypothetical protein
MTDITIQTIIRDLEMECRGGRECKCLIMRAANTLRQLDDECDRLHEEQDRLHEAIRKLEVNGYGVIKCKSLLPENKLKG